MKHRSALTWIIPLIGVLAFIAAGAGLLYQDGGPSYPAISLRGEQVMINAQGLYYYDTISSAAQMHGNDIVTIVIGVPLLLGSFWHAARRSLRGHLLLTGTLGYFLYTYISMVFGTAYNALFLVYVALFSLSLFAFILSMLAFDVASLPGYFTARFPRRGIASLLFTMGGFLLLAWLGRIVPPLLRNQTPALENGTSLFIQALDLGLIVPLSFLAGILLLRQRPWGYLLASVAVMKFITMGLAVSAMAINMARIGVAVSLIEVIVFPMLTLVNIVFAGLLLKYTRRSSTPSRP